MSSASSRSFARKACFSALTIAFISASGFDTAEARSFGGGGTGGYSAPRAAAPPSMPRSTPQTRPSQNPSSDINNPAHPLNPLNPLNPLSPVSPLNPMYHVPSAPAGDTTQEIQRDRVVNQPSRSVQRNNSSNTAAFIIFGGLLAGIGVLAWKTAGSSEKPDRQRKGEDSKADNFKAPKYTGRPTVF